MASDTENGGKRLTDEQRAAIPLLYATHRSYNKVANVLGISREAVGRWMHNLSGEEWDRIIDEQRQSVADRALDILYEAFELIPGKLKEANMHDLLGTVKIMSDRLAGWGSIGAAQAKTAQGPAGDAEAFLAAAESSRRQAAIEEAVRTGNMEPLKAFVKA
jgi:hypothetical protein